jgi:hypothetical protein
MSEEKYISELKKLNDKMSSISGYLIAMRVESNQDLKKIIDILRSLLKHISSTKGGVWISFIVILFTAFLSLRHNI